MLRYTIITVIALLFCSSIKAQTEPEYLYEIGGGVGMMTYEGDFNSSVLSGNNMSPSVELMLKRVINPYSALRISVGYGQMKGDTKNLYEFFPDFNTQEYKESDRIPYSFSNALVNLGALYEYNFLPFGTGKEYRGAKRLTPFIGLGLGLTYVNCSKGTTDLGEYDKIHEGGVFGSPDMNGSKTVLTANIPIGFGVKCKATQRLNISLEWMAHFSLSDKLDGVKDAHRVASSGFFANVDCYSNLQLAITYSFKEKCRTCHKDDW